MTLPVLRPVIIVLAVAVLVAGIVLFWPRGPSRYCVVDGDMILPASMCDDGARMYEAP
jgi:hypothetical protein